MSAVIEESRVEISTDVEAVLNYTRNTGVRPVRTGIRGRHPTRRR